MPRQLYFKSQVRPAGVNLPAMPHVASVPQVRSQGVELLHGLANLGEAAARLVIQRDNQRQAGLVEEAYNSAREQMTRWTADYQRGHQGSNALDAQAAYEQQWAKISAGIREQYGERMYGGTQALLGRRLELGRIQALEHGAAYQARQTGLWHDDLDKRSLALLEADIAADPGNFQFHDVRLRETLDGLRQRHPGRDFTGTELKLRQNVAEAQFNGLLAAGRLEDADAFLQRHGGPGATPGAAGGYSGIGFLAVGHESGGDPGAISPDTSGSKSYGLFQFNNKGGKGTANSFLPFLKNTHPKLYEALGSGAHAVGSAEFDAKFKQTARGPLRQEMIQAQEEHLQAQYAAPAQAKLQDSDVHKALAGNAAYEEVLLSTAIQHGPGGANRILREAWGLVDHNADAQTQLEQFITATYQLRGRPGKFRTALSEKTSDAAKEQFLGVLHNRFQQEAAQALALAHGQGGASADIAIPKSDARSRYCYPGQAAKGIHRRSSGLRGPNARHAGRTPQYRRSYSAFPPAPRTHGPGTQFHAAGIEQAAG